MTEEDGLKDIYRTWESRAKLGDAFPTRQTLIDDIMNWHKAILIEAINSAQSKKGKKV